MHGAFVEGVKLPELVRIAWDQAELRVVVVVARLASSRCADASSVLQVDHGQQSRRVLRDQQTVRTSQIVSRAGGDIQIITTTTSNPLAPASRCGAYPDARAGSAQCCVSNVDPCSIRGR